MQKIKKMIVFAVLFTSVYSMSGCGFLKNIEAVNSAREKARQERLAAIESEVTYDYAFVTSNYVSGMLNQEKMEYSLYGAAREILGKGEESYDVVGTKEKAYFCFRYNTYTEETQNEEGYTDFSYTYDVALLSFTYKTGECELLYDYKYVAPTFSNNWNVHRRDCPKVFTYAGDGYGILYENGYIKVLNLETKEITYEHQVYEDARKYADFSEGSPYGDGRKYVDYIHNNIYYEYKNGGFIPHTFAFEGMQDGDVGPFKNSYYEYQNYFIYRIGNYIYSKEEKKAFDITTGEEVSFEDTQKGVYYYEFYEEAEDGERLIPFESNGKQYYRNLGGNSVYDEKKNLIVDLNLDYLESSGNQAYQQLKVFYDGETEYEPDTLSLFVVEGKCLLWMRYEIPLFFAYAEYGPFLFEYELETGTLKYVDSYSRSWDGILWEVVEDIVIL